MTDKPIVFSAPMVRALLREDSPKTQDRLVLKPQPSAVDADGRWYRMPSGGLSLNCHSIPYAVGDRLWVRERWRVGAWHWSNATIAVDYDDGPRKEWLDVDDGDMLHRLIDQSREDARKADAPLRHSYYEYSWSPGNSPCRWRSPIHMPRWASRIALLVTDVRMQRVQDVSEADAIAEGLSTATKDGTLWKFGIPDRDGLPGRDNTGWAWVDWEANPRAAYRRLWNSIHGADAWDRNDWVAAYSFERLPA